MIFLKFNFTDNNKWDDADDAKLSESLKFVTNDFILNCNYHQCQVFISLIFKCTDNNYQKISQFLCYQINFIIIIIIKLKYWRYLRHKISHAFIEMGTLSTDTLEIEDEEEEKVKKD